MITPKQARQMFKTFITFSVAVYQEVENRISKFRHMLFDKLMDLPAQVDEQKKLIRSAPPPSLPSNLLSDPPASDITKLEYILINFED